MKVVFSVVVQERGNNDIELWREPEDFSCIPAVGDSVSLYKGGFGQNSKVEERTFAVEGGVVIRLAPVKNEVGMSSSVLMGQGWKHDRPYFR